MVICEFHKGIIKALHNATKREVDMTMTTSKIIESLVKTVTFRS
jgi:hypothetical protein